MRAVSILLTFKKFTIKIRAHRKYSCFLLQYVCVRAHLSKWVGLYLFRV